MLFLPTRLTTTTAMATRTLRRTCPPGTRIASIRARNLHASRPTRDNESKKEAIMDKDGINTESNEYSKSGGDKQAAESDTAFDPAETRPEEESENTGALEMSPKNQGASEARDPNEGGSDHAPEKDRQRTSGGGSPNKNSTSR